VIGLEDRLRTVEGVASIRVELGEEGVDAIKVEVHPGADEAGVLEEIRQVLVAYGLRSRKPGWKLGSRRTPPAIVAEIAEVAGVPSPAPGRDLFDLRDGGLPPIGETPRNGTEVRLDVTPPEGLVDGASPVRLGMVPPPVPPLPKDQELPKDHEMPRVRVQQGGKGLVITLSGSGREVEATADISPIGAAEAMAKVVSDFHGLVRPDRVAVVMHELDGERVVTLLLRRGSDSAIAVEVARPMLHDALYLATQTALRRLESL
jgi:hypothetical protein